MIKTSRQWRQRPSSANCATGTESSPNQWLQSSAIESNNPTEEHCTPEDGRSVAQTRDDPSHWFGIHSEPVSFNLK